MAQVDDFSERRSTGQRILFEPELLYGTEPSEAHLANKLHRLVRHYVWKQLPNARIM